MDLVGTTIPGSRVLAKARSSAGDWLVDLPVATAIKAPSAIELSTGEVTGAREHTSWYREQLHDAYGARNQQADITPAANVRKEFDDVVIVNCIDHLYGHCLLKLLNSDYHHQRQPNVGICVLIQPQLRHMIPDYVAEVWEVPVKLADGVQWYDSIDRWIQARLPKYKSVSVSRAYSHLSPQYYDIQSFAGNRIQPLSELCDRSPIVHFSCRPDRCWGHSEHKQQQRLRRLYFQLRQRYEKIGFVISGFGEAHTFDDDWHSGWIDLRTTDLDSKKEDRWISSMAVADVAVGVHGSNMLLPTAFAQSSVIMLPFWKYDGIALDVLMPKADGDPREEMLNYAFVYGDDNLLDVSPQRLSKVIANKLGYSRINMEWFRHGPDYENTELLNELLMDRERVSAVHRNERLNFLGRLKRGLRYQCLKLIAALE